MIIAIDIETIPTQRDDLRAIVAAGVKPPATLKNALTLAEWEEKRRPEAVEDAIAATSLDGGLGQIVCIGWAVDDEPAQSIQAEDSSLSGEMAVLDEWFGRMRLHDASGRRPIIVGHNVIEFDLPFIWKRAIVHGVRPPIWLPRDPKPWGDSVFDTMTQWAGSRGRISMDRLCRVLDLPGKGDGPTGADVWPLVQAGRIDDVAAYCRDDVDRTRAIYRRMRFSLSAP